MAAVIRDKTDGGRAGAQGEPALDRRQRSTSRRSRASTAAAATGARPGFSTDLTYPELVEFLRAEATALAADCR